MEIAAAAAFVGVFLLTNGLYQTLKNNIWLIGILIAATIGTAIWLAAAANLWPLYVMAGAYTLVLILVIVFSTLKAIEDAEKARMEYNANL
jgi:hypothetical protein